MLPSILHNQSNIHDYATLILKHYGGTFHFKGPWFTNNSNFIITSDPMNVHHSLSKNFSNYGKGTDFPEIFEIFGVGIFNLDSNEWKQERTLLHSILKTKKFETSAQQNIRKKLENCLLPFVDHHASTKGVQVFDLQDILERFTFDITCTFLFGFDPNSLPYKFNELPDIALPADIACANAISLLEDMTTSRHYIPKCIWKLQIKNG
jgi:cytochrome P450